MPGALRPSPEEVRAAASNTSSSPLISVENVTVIGSKRKKNPVSNSSNSDAVHGATMTGDSNMTSDANNISERASIVPILSTVAANSLGERGSGGGGGQDVSGIRRQQQQQVSSSSSGESIKHFHYLTLTVRKDENGYGMKVGVRKSTKFLNRIDHCHCFRCLVITPFLWKVLNPVEQLKLLVLWPET